MHPAEAHCGGDHMVSAILRWGEYLLVRELHSIETRQLSELSLQRVCRLLLFLILLCARLIERLAFWYTFISYNTSLGISSSDGPFSERPDP